MENYEEDLEEMSCHDCKKKLGYILPDMCVPFVVCDLCMTANKYAVADEKSLSLKEQHNAE